MQAQTLCSRSGSGSFGPECLIHALFNRLSASMAENLAVRGGYLLGPTKELLHGAGMFVKHGGAHLPTLATKGGCVCVGIPYFLHA